MVSGVCCTSCSTTEKNGEQREEVVVPGQRNWNQLLDPDLHNMYSGLSSAVNPGTFRGGSDGDMVIHLQAEVCKLQKELMEKDQRFNKTMSQLLDNIAKLNLER